MNTDSHNLERDAGALDAADPLGTFRARFAVPPGVVYMDGNSLGLMPDAAEAAVLRVLAEWRKHGVEGWLDAEPPWFTLAERVAAEMAPLIGASPDEIAIANSTTVNLHQLLATLFRPGAQRHAILADPLNFPSDLYAIRSHLRLRGLDPSRSLRLAPSRDGLTLDEGDIIAAMDQPPPEADGYRTGLGADICAADRKPPAGTADGSLDGRGAISDVGVIVLPTVLYAGGQLLDVARLAAEARRRSILFGLDLSHSIGALPHALDEWGVDFAFWCSYKYLNAGPGAIGGLYLNRRHHGAEPGLAGWFGSRRSTQFDMLPELDSAPDASRLHVGTPNILSVAAVQGALEVVNAAGIARIRRKSLDLTAFLMALADAELAEFGVRVANPREEERRGGHVALAHPEATRLCRALKAARVVPDFRPPDIVRLAPVALYNTFEDCFRAVATLRSILETGEHLNYEAGRGLVA